MQQTLGALHDFNKSAEIKDPLDLPVVNLTELGFSGNAVYNVYGLLGGFSIRRCYIDKSAVLYIYLYTRLLHNSSDNFSTGPYHFADLVLPDLHCIDPRCIRRKVFTRRADRLIHFVDDKKSAF